MTNPEGIAMIGAGLMSRPADRRWMVSGVFDGMVPKDPSGNVKFGVQVFDSEGTEVVLEGDNGDLPPVPNEEDLTDGRLFILLSIPPMTELASGFYHMRVTALGTSQDIPFVVATSDDADTSA
jgi:hypothetical protein